jgi:hypothetical protein
MVKQLKIMALMILYTAFSIVAVIVVTVLGLVYLPKVGGKKDGNV